MKEGLVNQEPNTPVTKIIEIGGIKMEVDMRLGSCACECGLT
ncbi:hypothetical protein ES703_97792 [subsurface metagenome]